MPGPRVEKVAFGEPAISDLPNGLNYHHPQPETGYAFFMPPRACCPGAWAPGGVAGVAPAVP